MFILLTLDYAKFGVSNFFKVIEEKPLGGSTPPPPPPLGKGELDVNWTFVSDCDGPLFFIGGGGYHFWDLQTIFF